MIAEKDAVGGIRFSYIYCHFSNYSYLSGCYRLLKSYYVPSIGLNNSKLLSDFVFSILKILFLS